MLHRLYALLPLFSSCNVFFPPHHFQYSTPLSSSTVHYLSLFCLLLSFSPAHILLENSRESGGAMIDARGEMPILRIFSTSPRLLHPLHYSCSSPPFLALLWPSRSLFAATNHVIWAKARTNLVIRFCSPTLLALSKAVHKSLADRHESERERDREIESRQTKEVRKGKKESV